MEIMAKFYRFLFLEIQQLLISNIKEFSIHQSDFQTYKYIMKKNYKLLLALPIIYTFLSSLPYVATGSTLSTNLIDENSVNSLKNEQKYQNSRQSLPYHELPIYGNASLGYYYVKIFVGSPDPQPQSVIVDTGSGLLAVPGAECRRCSRTHIDPPYDPKKSDSSVHLTCSQNHPACQKSCKNQVSDEQCTFSIYYAEGSSLQGYIVEDDIRFQTYSQNQQIRTYFGYTNRQTNYFLTQKANGIFGLAPKRQTDLLEKMVEKHSPTSGQKLRFSLCLSINGGIMTIGGLNTKLHKQKLNPDITIPFSDKQNLYSLNGVKQISIEEELLHLPGDKFGMYGIFIDSGSTFSYLPKSKFNILENKLNKTCLESGVCEVGRGEDSTCYRLNLAEEETLEKKVEELFPPIEFYILDKKIYWSPTKYMLVREKNQVCLGVLGLDRYLLGANWMYERDIVFDLENKNIEIYDGVNCQQAPEKDNKMGRYLSDDIKSVSTIEFKDGTQVRINTNSWFFIVGVVSLFAAIIILILMKCGFCQQKQKIKEVEAEKQPLGATSTESQIIDKAEQ